MLGVPSVRPGSGGDPRRHQRVDPAPPEERSPPRKVPAPRARSHLRCRDWRASPRIGATEDLLEGSPRASSLAEPQRGRDSNLHRAPPKCVCRIWHRVGRCAGHRRRSERRRARPYIRSRYAKGVRRARRPIGVTIFGPLRCRMGARFAVNRDRATSARGGRPLGSPCSNPIRASRHSLRPVTPPRGLR